MSSVVAEPHSLTPNMPMNEFDYRPTPIAVPVSVALGLLSASSLLGVIGILVAIIGTGVGLMAVWKVKSGEGAYSGMGAAIAGLLLSMTFAIAGVCSQVYAFNTEVPEGFSRVSFSQDISAKGFPVVEGKVQLHPEVEKLIDQKIFLKGYMYPQRQNEGLLEFLLLKDTGECCFGGQPNPTDMILVQVLDDKGVTYSQGRVAVAGTFKLTQDTTPEGLQPVYAIEIEHFDRSRSAF